MQKELLVLLAAVLVASLPHLATARTLAQRSRNAGLRTAGKGGLLILKAARWIASLAELTSLHVVALMQKPS